MSLQNSVTHSSVALNIYEYSEMSSVTNEDSFNK